MLTPKPSSPEARERERSIVFMITSPFAAIALVYGIASAHPPLLFLAAFGLLGMAFTSILLWGNRTKRTRLALVLAFSLFWLGGSAIERAFFARPLNDMPDFAFIAALAVFSLGCTLAFTLSRLWKDTSAKPAANG